ncbi:hypothetical protein L7F22_048734 [Adiantum nelumboides]|nr:hypothetical protein [Adiantum nelumboides]
MRCEGNQVDVTTLVPGQVVSGMNEGPPTANMPTSHDFIRTTISKLSGGLFGVRPPPIMVPWMAHSMGYLAMQLMPRAMATGPSALRSSIFAKRSLPLSRGKNRAKIKLSPQ